MGIPPNLSLHTYEVRQKFQKLISRKRLILASKGHTEYYVMIADLRTRKNGPSEGRHI